MRLINHIERETLALISRTFLSLSYEVGVTEDTIRHIFDTCVHRLEQAYILQAPRILGIDEVYLLGSPRCVLTDIGNKRVLDLLINRTQKSVMKWLQQLPEKRHIHVVAMDMWQPYRNAVREIFPLARIIVDKFCVIEAC